MTTQTTTPPRYETNFTRMVDEDIQSCERFLAGDRDEKMGEELHIALVAKYPSYIAHFGDYLRKFNPECGFVMLEYFDRDSLVHDLIVMKSRLIAFKNHGYKNSYFAAGDSSKGPKCVQSATPNQTAQITFEDVKQKTIEMTGLTDAKTMDILEKVEAIEAIAKSNEPKKTKWLKFKPILGWLADESVDVGTAILPLILKIGD